MAAATYAIELSSFCIGLLLLRGRLHSWTHGRKGSPMTTSGLAPSLIAKVSAVLGSSGQLHFSDATSTPTPTNCMLWRTAAARADVALTAVRAALAGEAAIAYKHHHVWLSPYESEADGIVVCPSTDQFDSLRVEMGSAGFPNGDEVIAELADYDREYGVQIDGAHYSTVEFR